MAQRCFDSPIAFCSGFVLIHDRIGNKKNMFKEPHDDDDSRGHPDFDRHFDPVGLIRKTQKPLFLLRPHFHQLRPNVGDKKKHDGARGRVGEENKSD